MGRGERVSEEETECLPQGASWPADALSKFLASIYRSDAGSRPVNGAAKTARRVASAWRQEMSATTRLMQSKARLAVYRVSETPPDFGT